MTESIITLPLDAIQADTRAQSRAEIDIVVVGEYADDMKAGAVFPPLVVFFDQATYWLAEGFHRYHAYQQAEITPVPVLVKAGGLREAILQSLGSNADHGKRRTNADKRRAVEMMLRDGEWNNWPQAQIAKQCVVTPEYVSRLRKELSIDRSIDTPRTATRNGTTYTINTGNIGRKAEPVATMCEDDPPFEAEFEDEDGNPVSFPAIDDEEAQFLAELDAEAAALDEVPPVVADPLLVIAAVTEKVKAGEMTVLAAAKVIEKEQQNSLVRDLQERLPKAAPSVPGAPPPPDPVFETVLPNGKKIADGDPKALWLWGWMLECEDRFLSTAPDPTTLASNFLEFMEQDSQRLIPQITRYLNQLLEVLHEPVA